MSPIGDWSVCDGDERAGRRLHELCRDAQLVARAQQGPEQTVVDVRLRRERLEVGRLAGEARDRGARAHHDRGQPGQRVGDGVREREREEVDLRVGPQHPEGQHHEPRQRRATSAPLRSRRRPGRCRARRAISAADAGRSAGRLASAAGSRGRGAITARRRREPAAARAASRAAPRRRVAPRKAGRPAIASYRIAPAEKRSVRASIVVAEHLLRRHVARRAHDQARPRELRAALERLRQARAASGPRETEVEQLHARVAVRKTFEGLRSRWTSRSRGARRVLRASRVRG